MKRRPILIGAALMLLSITALYGARLLQQSDPTVRIGLTQTATTVTIRSTQPFRIDQEQSKSAKFTTIVSVDPAARSVRREDLQYRMMVELDGGKLLVFPMDSKVRMEPGGAWMELDN